MSISGIIALGLTQTVSDIVMIGLESGDPPEFVDPGTKPSTQPAGDPSWPNDERTDQPMKKWEGD